jgi:hypothetical protein
MGRVPRSPQGPSFSGGRSLIIHRSLHRTVLVAARCLLQFLEEVRCGPFQLNTEPHSDSSRGVKKQSKSIHRKTKTESEAFVFFLAFPASKLFFLRRCLIHGLLLLRVADPHIFGSCVTLSTEL